MANSFDSNVTRQLARVFLEKFESARVVTKNVNTQLLAGKFNPASGATVDFKRPTDYRTNRDATGDATGFKDDITTGKATGTVQDYFTAFVDFDEADEAIKMDQIDELLEPMASRIVTDLELDFADFMMKNSGLLGGTYGNAISATLGWDDIAEWSAVMQSTGVPMNMPWKAMLNPHTVRRLASSQRSLGSGGAAGALVKTAHERATITKNFANMDVMTGTTLSSYSSGAYGGDLAGTVSSADVTYLTAKDTMTQSIVVAGIGTFSGTIPAGTVWQVTGVNAFNLNTRKAIIDADGAVVLWTATQTADSTFSSGGGTIILTGPAIFEASGAYNTCSATIVGKVITILTAVSTLFQPNLFWHPNAFGIGSVPIKKLFSTDTIAKTKDGLEIRVSKFADGVTNVQSVRFDLRPAFAVFNPFLAGQGFGV